MLLFENKKIGKVRIIKLFGVTVYTTVSDYKRRKQWLLGNFISTVKAEELDVQIKTIKFFGRQVARRERNADYEKKYILNKLVKNLDLKREFINKYRKYVKGYDDIIILNAKSGETYLFLTHIFDVFIKKNNCKNILLIATKIYHMDLINLICPEIAHVYIKNIKLLKNSKTIIDKQNFYTVFVGDYFYQVEQNIKNNPIGTFHYFKSILDNLGIKEDEIGFRKISIPKHIENSAILKAKKIGLNLNNFIFLAPEAASCKEINTSFWLELAEKLKDQGFDVFFNIANKKSNIKGKSIKKTNLTFAEAFALARMSRGIVSLRSGLSEVLLQTNLPMCILYTNFKNRHIYGEMPVERVMSGFGINKLPSINSKNIFELEVSKNNKIEIISGFITKIQGTNYEISK